jgi:hypothetical protein
MRCQAQADCCREHEASADQTRSQRLVRERLATRRSRLQFDAQAAERHKSL